MVTISFQPSRTAQVAGFSLAKTHAILNDDLLAQMKKAFPSLQGTADLAAYRADNGETIILLSQDRKVTYYVLRADGTLSHNLTADDQKTFKTAINSFYAPDPAALMARLKDNLKYLRDNKEMIVTELKKQRGHVDGLGNPMTAKEVYAMRVDEAQSEIKAAKKVQKNHVNADDTRSFSF